jgi:hypothetical protein
MVLRKVPRREYTEIVVTSSKLLSSRWWFFTASWMFIAKASAERPRLNFRVSRRSFNAVSFDQR